MASKKWTEEEDKVLRRAARENLSADTVLDLLTDRSPGAVRARLMVLNLPGGHKYRRLDRLSQSPEARMKRVLRERAYTIKYQKEQYSHTTKYTERKCLKCGKEFMSWGPGNRLCPDHRHADGYEMI